MELAHYQEYANVLLVGLAIAVKKLFACKGVRMGESVLPQIYAHAPVEGGLGTNVKKVT